MIFNVAEGSEEKHKLDQVSTFIKVHQEMEGDTTFKDMKVYRDQIIVIDRCNRLTYQVVMPWSILTYPYVKAAIVSTYIADPCGNCTMNHTIPNSEETTERSDSSMESMNKVEKVYQKIKDHNTDSDLDSDTDSTTMSNIDTTTTERSEVTTEMLKHILEDIASSWSTPLVDHALINESNNYGNRVEKFEKIEEIIVEEDEKMEEPSQDLGATEKTRNFGKTALEVDKRIFEETDYVEEGAASFGEVEETFAEEAEKLYKVNETINGSEDSSLAYQLNKTAEDSIFNPTESPNEEPRVEEENQTISHKLMPYDFGENQSKSPAVDEIYDVNSKNDNSPPSWPPYNYSKKKSRKNRKKMKENVDSNTPFPLKIILRNPHEHSDGTNHSRHHYLVLKVGDPAFHNHIPDDKDIYEYRGPEDHKDTSKNQILKRKESIIFEKYLTRNETGMVSINGTGVLPDNQVVKVPKGELFYGYNVPEETEDDSMNFMLEEEQEQLGQESEGEVYKNNDQDSTGFDIREESEEVQELVKHYSKLLPWVPYPI